MNWYIYIDNDDDDDDDDDDVWSSRRILQSYGMIYIHDHSYECSMWWWIYNNWEW